MGFSYTEELVSEYYKHLTGKNIAADESGKIQFKPKFIVSEHVQFKMKSKGWSDIDVLAIAKDEIHVIQTKCYGIFTKTKAESIKTTVNYFDEAEQFVKDQYDTEGKMIKKIFVADLMMADDLEKCLLKYDITPRKLSEIMIEYLDILRKLHPDISRLGKEESNVTRILMFLQYSFKEQMSGIR